MIVIPVADVPLNYNLITSNVIYKINVEYQKFLKLKSRIAPHSNEDLFSDYLKRDCAMRSPLGVRLVLFASSFSGCRISKLDVKSALLQTGEADRGEYLVPTKERTDRGKAIWLLLAAYYGLINTNAKWNVYYDEIVRRNRIIECPLDAKAVYKALQWTPCLISR